MSRSLLEPQFSSDRGACSSYQNATGVSEHYVAIHSDPDLDFRESLEALALNLREAYRSCDLTSSAHVFTRFFFRNIKLHKHDLLGSAAFRLVSGGAVSFIQQPPLNGGDLSVLTCLIGSPRMAARRNWPRRRPQEAASFPGASYTLHFNCNLRCGANCNTYSQTLQVFSRFQQFASSNRMTIPANAVRTWLFVNDIDRNYREMADGRRDFFEACGMTPETHYIASTGIEGETEYPTDLVSMDALSIEGLSPGQMSYLSAPDHLNPTHEYGVTFERGTRVRFGDRVHHYISGTASIDRHGRVLHENDVEGQTRRAVANINALLAPDRLTLDDMAYLIVYLRNSIDYPQVRRVLQGITAREIPRVCLAARVCRPAWLVEIEAFGVSDCSTNFATFF